jgi:hypothetical protein
VPEGRDAVIADASFAGLAIEVGEPWLETRFLLNVTWLRRRCYFRCLLVAPETTPHGIVLHSKLVELGGLQRQVLRDIITTSKTSFEEAQRFLALRANDPERYRATISSTRRSSTRHGRPAQARATSDLRTPPA